MILKYSSINSKTAPGETILDGSEYHPKRLRTCDEDSSLIEAELKSEQSDDFFCQGTFTNYS